MEPKIVPFDEVFDSSEQSVLTTVWDEEAPEGKFVKGRHGCTHYVVDGADNNKGVIVLSHGVGTSSHMYRKLSALLVDAGYTVIRYDFFNHGYSKYTGGSNMWVPYEPDMFIDQVEDILTVFARNDAESKKDFVAFVGHSTGGIAGIYASERWMSSSQFRPKNFILISPAIYATKPLVAKLADMFPSTFGFLFRFIPISNVLISDAYTDAGKIAFGEIDDKYVYPQQEKDVSKLFDRLFGKVKGVKKHPTLQAGINSCNWGMLRGSELPVHRETFRKVLKENETTGTMKFTFLWGDLDRTVPFKPHYEESIKKWQEDDFPQYFTVQPLEKLGHESIYENSEQLGKQLLESLQE